MKKRYLAIVLLLVFTMFPTASFAHNPEVVEKEGSLLLFQFDTGDTMYGAKLIVQDAEGNELHHEFVKEDGLFDYGEYVDDIHKIIVNDGGGHLVEFEITDDMKQNLKSNTGSYTMTDEQALEVSKDDDTEAHDSGRREDNDATAQTADEKTDEKSDEASTQSQDVQQSDNSSEETSNNLMYYILGGAIALVVVVGVMSKNKKK